VTVAPDDQIRAAHTHAIDEARAEINLFVDAPAAREQAQPAHAPVQVTAGIVQIGNYNQATQHITVNDQSRRAVTAAMDAVEAALNQGADVARADDLRQIAADVRQEIAAAAPNQPRLLTEMQALAAAFQGIASGGQAYEVIRGALALLGVPI